MVPFSMVYTDVCQVIEAFDIVPCPRLPMTIKITVRLIYHPLTVGYIFDTKKKPTGR